MKVYVFVYPYLTKYSISVTDCDLSLSDPSYILIDEFEIDDSKYTNDFIQSKIKENEQSKHQKLIDYYTKQLEELQSKNVA